MSEKKKIFILDDEEDILISLRQMLEADGFEVKVFSSPKDVIDEIKAFGPDVILLDLLMPGLSGFEVCQILNKDVETASTPIIVVSGYSDQADIKRAYKLGIESYITKPYDYAKLLAEIKKLISFKGGEIS